MLGARIHLPPHPKAAILLFTEDKSCEISALPFQDMRRVQLRRSPLDFCRPALCKCLCEFPFCAGSQQPFSIHFGVKTAAKHAKDEAIRKWRSELLDNVENEAALIALGPVHQTKVRI